MINQQEKTNIKDKIMTVAQFSNVMISVSETDSMQKQVATILHGMIKDFIKWLDEMPTSKKHLSGRHSIIRSSMEDDNDNGNDEDDEEPTLSKAQLAAKAFVNGGISLSDAKEPTYEKVRGRKPGSKNKSK